MELIEKVINQKNSLHYTELADYLGELSKTHTERKLAELTGIPKSQIHRYIKISKLDVFIKISAKNNNIQKYAILDYADLSPMIKSNMYQCMILGKIKTRKDFKRSIKSYS